MWHLAARAVHTSSSSRRSVIGELLWWVHRRQLVFVCWRGLTQSETCRLRPTTRQLRTEVWSADDVRQFWPRRARLSRVLRPRRRRSTQSAQLPSPRRTILSSVDHCEYWVKLKPVRTKSRQTKPEKNYFSSELYPIKTKSWPYPNLNRSKKHIFDRRNIVIISSMPLVERCCLHKVPPVSTILCSPPRSVDHYWQVSSRFQQLESMSVLVALEVFSSQQRVALLCASDNKNCKHSHVWRVKVLSCR